MKQIINRLCSLFLVATLLLSCVTICGGKAHAVESGITQTFEGCTPGIVKQEELSGFTFDPDNFTADDFSVVAEGTAHGNVLAVKADSNPIRRLYMDTAFAEKRISFDMKVTGTLTGFNGLYFYPNYSEYAGTILTPGTSTDMIGLQEGTSSRNHGMMSLGMQTDVWYTVVIEDNNEFYRVKVYPEGSEKTEWDFSTVNPTTPASATDTRVGFVLLNDGNTATFYFDNIHVELLEAETSSGTPTYTWFEEDFQDYDYGLLTKDIGAATEYSLLRGVTVVDAENNGESKVARLYATSKEPRFQISVPHAEKEATFDFRYDEAFSETGGIGVVMHSNANDELYYFVMRPNGTPNQILASAGNGKWAESKFVFEEKTWYTCKARLYAGKLCVKLWPTEEQEPEDWSFQTTATTSSNNTASNFSVFVQESADVESNAVLFDNVTVRTWTEVEKEKCFVSAINETPEAGTITGGGKYLKGSSATLVAESSEGYTFVGWKENGETVSTDASYTLTVEKDRVITACFEKVELVLRSFMANGMTVEPTIDEENKTVTLRLASDVDMQNVLCYFYKDIDAICSVEPYGTLDLSSGQYQLDDWVIYATKNSEMERFYVNAETGDDGNDGLYCCKPFKTIQRAIDAAAALDNWTGDVVIDIANGDYILSETLEFGIENSAEEGYALILQGEDAENTVISSGIKLTGWTESSDVEGAWEISVPEGIGYSRDLYINGERATLAKGDYVAPSGWGGYTDRSEMEKNSTGYLVDNGDMANWRNQSDIEFAYEVSWTFSIVPVDHIEAVGNKAQVVMNADAYKKANEKNGVQIVDPSYIQNAFELLDEPGEWYFDRTAQKIYYIPEEGIDPNTLNMVMPTLDKLVDADGTDDEFVYGITLKDIAFRYASYLKVHTEGHADIQANFTAGLDYLKPDLVMNNMNKTPGALTFDYAQGIRVQGCSFSCMSAGAVDFNVGVSASTIVGNRFEEIGASAVQIGTAKVRDAQPYSDHGYINGTWQDYIGWDPEPNRITHDNLILSNELHHIGTQFKGAIAILAGYVSDVTISHNTISNSSYSGISAGWGWGGVDPDVRVAPGSHWEYPSVQERYVIENNYISDIMQTLVDGGGVYTLSNMPGSMINGNVFKNFPGLAIYNDEATGGIVEISENISTDVEINGTAYWYNPKHNQTELIEAIKAGMHDNYWNVTSDDALYQTILNRAGTLPFISIPDLPADVPASGNTCTYVLTLNETPAKTVYTIGEELDLTGLSVSLNYHSGLIEPVTVVSTMVSGFDSSKAGSCEVVITYKGQSVSFFVTIKEAEQTTPEEPDEDIPVMPGNPVVKPTTSQKENTFRDVAPDAWYAEDVSFAVEHGIMNGVGDNCFAPDAAVTRGMVVTILWRLENKPSARGNSFTDVAADAWYAEAVQWASENGIVNGYGDGLFGPEDNVTRQQLATMIFRYAQYIGRDTTKSADLTAFADYARVEAYAQNAISWAVAEGLINGADGKLMPQGQATRAQLAAIIHRFVK